MRLEDTRDHVARKDLTMAVNAAIALERPLLVTTELARQAAADPAGVGGDTKSALPCLHGTLLKNEQNVHWFEWRAFMARSEGHNDR